ncbi:DUF4839 domain-containing protein [Pseudoclavibacter sp. JSM 162008]|uniref:DUF4839 domain-containing protein n=1 Tax=Pseudoclavibacter sp. JSM 162008 TaxID=3229855 RepID=UPI003525994F
MASDETQYETKTVQAIRGTESRAVAKWQKEGWTVVSQSPGTFRTEITLRRPKPKVPVKTLIIAGGVAAIAAAAVVLGMLFGDDDETVLATTPAPSAVETEAVPTSEPTAAAVEAAPPTVLTPETNADLAALLTQGDSCDPSIPAFVEKYKGQRISFPANIGYMQNHGSYDTRYDILIVAGDYSETSAPGPAMQFRDVNTVSDLNYVGTVPDAVGVGTNLLLTVEAAEYESSSCLLLLEPIETAIR